MSSDDVRPFNTVSRVLPSASSDNTLAPQRASRYGENISLPLTGSKTHTIADEGTYFVATNPTPGTGVAGIAAADGLDDLEALLFMRLGDASTKRVYLDWLLLEVTAAGTNGTNFAIAMKGDKGTSRYASGGSAITPKNPNMASAASSELSQLFFGAVVPTAATAQARLLHHARLRTVIKVVGDKYLFTFGASQPAPVSGIPTEGTLQACIQVPCPPVVLGAGDSFFLHEFATSQTVAASYQFSMGWWER